MDDLLTTKLRIPEARPGQVPRPRLGVLLDDGLRLGRRLTLVSAPPGFGKTTLIRDWVSTCGRSAAWLTLDQDDNDPGRFVRYLAAALGRADAPRDQFAPSLEVTPLSEVTPSPQAQLVALINRVAAEDIEWIVILDDYQEIRDFGVHELVAALLAHQPANLHLVIGTREDPPLPLPRLRGRDQVTEIRARTLRFTPEEAGIFLKRTAGLDLSTAAVTALANRTEGWITALQLAGVAIRTAIEAGAGDAAESFVAAFAGSDRYIVDYLVTEVLARQGETIGEFLRQTAILERLCAPLCEAVTGQTDAQTLLARLEATNLFLIPLDNHRSWYRYHALFAEALLLSQPPAQQMALHRRAAHWCDRNDQPELAVHHARRAASLAAMTRPVETAISADQPLVEPLSEREIEVLRLIAAGLSNQEIADRLIIAPGTVKRHINNIYGKLQVGSRTQAIAVGRDLQLL